MILTPELLLSSQMTFDILERGMEVAGFSALTGDLQDCLDRQYYLGVPAQQSLVILKLLINHWLIAEYLRQPAVVIPTAFYEYLAETAQRIIQAVGRKYDKQAKETIIRFELQYCGEDALIGQRLLYLFDDDWRLQQQIAGRERGNSLLSVFYKRGGQFIKSEALVGQYYARLSEAVRGIIPLQLFSRLCDAELQNASDFSSAQLPVGDLPTQHLQLLDVAVLAVYATRDPQPALLQLVALNYERLGGYVKRKYRFGKKNGIICIVSRERLQQALPLQEIRRVIPGFCREIKQGFVLDQTVGILNEKGEKQQMLLSQLIHRSQTKRPPFYYYSQIIQLLKHNDGLAEEQILQALDSEKFALQQYLKFLLDEDYITMENGSYSLV